MQSLIRMIAGTFVRSLIYKSTRRLGMPATVLMGILGAIVYVVAR
jgi:uncharacterized membrane protein YeaQ/YmgE (transglycosylase-associated protein family)